MSIEYGDQSIVHFLGRPGDRYFHGDEWPIYAPIMPWFKVDESRQDELDDELGIIARRTGIFVATTDEEEYLGRHRVTPIRRLVGAEALQTIRYSLTNAIGDRRRLGGTIRVIDSAKFNPHIVERFYDEIPTGQKIKVDAFSLVQSVDTPDGNREIIKNYKFEG